MNNAIERRLQKIEQTQPKCLTIEELLRHLVDGTKPDHPISTEMKQALQVGKAGPLPA